MAINPFRIGELQIPASPQQRPIDFSGLATLGEGLGRYREQQQVGELLAGAIDPATGQLDFNKAAKVLATSGRDPTKYLTLLAGERSQTRAEAAQQATEANYLATRAETERANRERERIQQQQADKPQYEVRPPTLLEEGQILELPRKPGQPAIVHPWPSSGGPALPPTPPPGPQSEAAPGALPGPAPTAAFNPEQAPPYQVAGPPTPPPTAPGAAPAAAPAPVRNEEVLQRLPTDAARTIVKGVAEYQIDPDKYDAKTREKIITAAKLYRPDYNTSEYQKRQTPPSSETQGRIGLGKGFLELVPQINTLIQNNELNTASGRFQAYYGQNRPGELVTAINSGADALVRGLTGAGMSIPEATKYAKAYEFVVYDTKDTQLRKVRSLDRALRYVVTEQGKGRGGEDFLKGFVSQFGEDVLPQEKKAPKKIATDEEANTLISQARGALKRDPEKRDEILKRLRERGVRNPELMLGQ